MSTRLISAWTPVIIKGGAFSSPLEFRDDADTVIPYTDPEIVITPNGASPLTWSIANGQISFVSTGIYTIFVDATETLTYLWTSGKYRLSVVDGAGNPIPCLIENLIFAKDC